ncbi:InlB B-repeat-containing protein, partial [Chloroflexota bacterium]
MKGQIISNIVGIAIILSMVAVGCGGVIPPDSSQQDSASETAPSVEVGVFNGGDAEKEATHGSEYDSEQTPEQISEPSLAPTAESMGPNDAATAGTPADDAGDSSDDRAFQVDSTQLFKSTGSEPGEPGMTVGGGGVGGAETMPGQNEASGMVTSAGGSGGTQAGAARNTDTKARLNFVDAKTCKDVQSSSPNDPIDIASVFSSTDAKSYTWLHFTNVYTSYQVRWDWYDPAGTYYTSATATIPHPSDYGYEYWAWFKCWGWIGINGYPPASNGGQWTVKVYLDNTLLTTLYFKIYILSDHTMCKDHQANDPWNAIDRTSTFSSQDVKAESWFRLLNLRQTLDITWRWYDPSGDLFYTSTHTTLDPTAYGYSYWTSYTTWASIPIKDQPPAQMLGEWTVDIYVDNEYQFSETFTIISQYTLTMQVSPAGGGTTTPSVGSHVYNAGTVVNLSASPSAGYRFDHWSGNASGTSATTSVTMNSDKVVTANFVRQYTLTMQVSPAGSGMTIPSVGSHTYDAGTVVSLNAAPNLGYRFSHWSGDASGTSRTTSVTMNSNKVVTANFILQYILIMQVSPAGGGTTTPSVGSHTYDAGTVVNLTAVPNAGYRFSHWSGDASGATATTSVTMNSDKVVTANFVRQYTLTMQVSPAGGGTTSPSVGSHTYDAGTVVSLSATPNAGYAFSHWSGDASSTLPSTSVTMDSDKVVTANFVRQYTLTMQVSPAGGGTTTPSVGSHTYDAGTPVNLSATPNADYTFDHWSGDVSGTSPSTSLTMDNDKAVTAHFSGQYTLTIHVDPPGSGVTAPSEGTHSFSPGTVVNLSTTPNTGYAFC